MRKIGVAIGIIAVCLTILAAAGPAAWGDAPVYRSEPSGAYMRAWLLCGPFPLGCDEEDDDTKHLDGFETDFLQAHGGERNLRVEEGQVERCEGGSATWRRWTSDSNIVDFDRAISERECVVGYACCDIESARANACLLALGSNDGISVWLNGEQVLDSTRGRPVRVDDDVVPVALREGRNRLLVKVEERGSRWGLCARLFAMDSGRFPTSRLNLFRVVNEDGAARLRGIPSKARLARIVRRAEIEVAPRGSPQTVVWRGEWSGEGDLPIGVDAEAYGEYVLRARCAFTGGVERTLEFPFAAGERVEHTLFADGETDYHIVVGREASESERWAAQELAHWLGEVSGAEFLIGDDSAPSGEHEIVVGFNDHARALLGETPPDDADESFTYRNVGPSIVIWGGSRRGTMYGVMTFLERELGCRWYSPRVSVAPRKQAFRFCHLQHSESPGVPVRNVFYYEAFDPTWAARNKVNGAMGYREQPGGIDAYWGVHTLVNRLVRRADYFAAHPEYFALVNGERYGGHDAQLCLTNPDVLAITIRELKAFMREHPEYQTYSVSQNDGGLYCQCPRCQALAEREGSQAGPVLWFVNQVAQAIEEEFPDKQIGTLAYVYSRKPPRTIRPRPNVVIRLCSFESDRVHDLATGERNTAFLDDLRRWGEIAPQIAVWDYVAHFGDYVMPFPNFRVLQPNVQLLHEAGVSAVMTQAAYQSRGAEFAELRAYLIARLLWDPDCDVEAVIDDFMSGYYGRSGALIRRYFDMVQDLVELDTEITQFSPFDPMFSEEFVRRAESLFDAAEVVADDEEVRQRVEMARLPIMYLKCRRTPAEAKRDGTYRRFCAIVEREGITHLEESGGLREFHAQMQDVK